MARTPEPAQTPESLSPRVSAAVDAWLTWLPKWEPATYTGRARPCKRCLGSPILQAAGIDADIPHQVCHALVSRMQRIIDAQVDAFTEAHLPMLHAELTGAAIWSAGGYDPSAGLDPEYEGLDLDPQPESGEQPYLFTMTELAEASKPEETLPRPPLSAGEKHQLRQELVRADECADQAGQSVCFALMGHRERIKTAIGRFVSPKIDALLEELSRHLEPPR